MKILVVSAYYPPHHGGGYELGCQDVVEQLRFRGHEMLVLTSDFRMGSVSTTDEPGVLRLLKQDGSYGWLEKKNENQKFVRALKTFKPDLVYFWGQSGICHWFAPLARWHGVPAAFFLSDTSFVSWRVGAWLAGVAQKHSLLRAVFGKTFLVRGWPVIRHRSCHFASEFLWQTARENGIAFDSPRSIVAHWGIDLAQFPAAPRERWPVRRLLYSGRLNPQKGVHTAIAALGLLAGEKKFSELTLTIAGGGLNLDYEARLRALPEQLGVDGRVRFLGRVPRAELARVYAEHDVLLFPSEWDEPFAITPLEAMAAGLAVVGTTTGGSGELFRNHETAMTFRAGDAEDCARALRELCADRELFEKISRNAQAEVRKKHTLEVMVDKIEQSLENLKWDKHQ